MKKLLALALILPFLFLATCAEEPEDQPNILGAKNALSGRSAAQYFSNKRLSLGWNGGNAFDGTGTLDETGWSSPRFTPTLFNGVKKAGFNVLRLPVTWSGRMETEAPYTINAEFIGRVAEVVDMAYNAGLVTVINIHHDSGWLSVSSAAQSDENYDSITARFTAIWQQVAERFKNYGDWLIFEPFNELHNGGWGWGNIPTREFEVINEWNQIFTDTVRAAGGCNAERFLIAKAYCAKPHQTLDAKFDLPTDSIPNKQIVSFHYYDPETFALNGTTNSWGTVNEQNTMTNLFAQFNTQFVSKNIPVIIGESGATYQSNRTGTEREIADYSRLLYFEWLGTQARTYGLVPILWDNRATSRLATRDNPNSETFGYINRETGELHTATNAHELIPALVSAVR